MPQVSIDNEIFLEWQRQSADGGTALDLILSSPTPPERVARALGGEVDVLLAAAEKALDSGSDDQPPWPGEWDWVRIGSDILIRVRDCEAPQIFLPAIAVGLERRGIAGALRRWEPLEVQKWPAADLLIECSLRVRGTRAHRGGRRFAWRPDEEAQERLIDVASRWCVGDDGRGAPVVDVRALPTFLLSPGEDLDARLREDNDGRKHFGAWIATSAGARMVCVHPATGRVSLIEVPAAGASRVGWRDGLTRIRAALSEAADLVVYGFVKPGTSPIYAKFGDSLTHDWPHRPGLDPDLLRGFTATAFEDSYALDAFPLQLLGPGYRGRIPVAPSYRAENFGDSVLLEHVDLAAWFAAPLIPPGTRRQEIPALAEPRVLANARAELDSILYDPSKHPHN